MGNNAKIGQKSVAYSTSTVFKKHRSLNSSNFLWWSHEREQIVKLRNQIISSFTKFRKFDDLRNFSKTSRCFPQECFSKSCFIATIKYYFHKES